MPFHSHLPARAGCMSSSTAEPDHRPQGKPGDPLEPPRHKSTAKLPKVAEAVCSLAAESALIDGDAVAFRRTDISTARTLEKRRDALLRLVGVVDSILFSDALVADGALVFALSSRVARNQRDP